VVAAAVVSFAHAHGIVGEVDIAVVALDARVSLSDIEMFRYMTYKRVMQVSLQHIPVVSREYLYFGILI
jgi:hypothetical protein